MKVLVNINFMGMVIILNNHVAPASLQGIVHMCIKKSHLSLRDCKEQEHCPHSWWKSLLNQHLLLHTTLSINQIAQSIISLTVFFGKDYSSAEVIPLSGPRRKKIENKHWLSIHSKMIHIYKMFGHRLSRCNYLRCVVKNKTHKKMEKKNVVILKYCI